MLHQLPPEIMLAISSDLDFADKLNLIATCRLVYNLISKTNLYSKLDLLTNSRRETERVIRIFKKKRSFGAQVRQLSIPIDLLSDKLFSELATVFPYVTRVSVDDEPNSHQDTITFGDRNSRGPMLKWKNTIETYNLSQNWIGVLQILETTTFPMLSELVLGHYFDFDDKEEGFDTTYFTQYIQHAPKLKNLVLHHCAIDTELLEKIHTSCLHLESLVLKNAVIMIKERKLLQPILPAYTVSSLLIRSTHLFDRNGVLLTYITKKYRHLRNLQLDLKRAFDIEDFQRYYRESDMFTNENNDQDEADDEDEDGDGDDNDVISVDTIDELREEYLSIYQTLRSDLKASLEVCHTTGREFVSTLSNKIRTMRISFDLLGDILEAIAKSNTRPAILEFKTNDWYYPWLLGDPQQIPYIKEITSLKTLKLGLKLPAQVYSQSFSPNRITKLSIHLYNDPFYIDWLFSMFPLLEELYIICGHRLTVRIDENSSFAQGDLVKHFPNLLKLVVKCGKIDQKCFDFFKTTSPNITHLNLEAFFLPNSPNEHFTIDISGWDLKLCTILLFKKFAQEKHILYKTMVSTLSPKAFNDTEGYKYICGVLNKASSYKLFNLVCRNRQSLVINGHSLTALDDTVAVYKL